MKYDTYETRCRILYLLSGSTVANTTIIALALGIEINATRRVLDKMVAKGVLERERSTFWNGMHYATRNYYWRKQSAKDIK